MAYKSETGRMHVVKIITPDERFLKDIYRGIRSLKRIKLSAEPPIHGTRTGKWLRDGEEDISIVYEKK